ncbi:MAG TPA: hypothetical protein ENK43_04410 [Planctomycetes bacterium]|nr:hypothetical protein [Planctomycetota bacterium]
MTENVNDPGPGAKGDPAQGGAGATNPTQEVDVAAIVSESVKKAVAEATGQLVQDFEAKLKTQAENHANQVRRLKSKSAGGAGNGGEGQSQGTGISPDLQAELDALREQNQRLQAAQEQAEAQRKAAMLDSQLNDAIASISGLADGAPKLIRQALRAGLDFNSQGEVVFRDGQKHIALADKLAELASYPGFQAPANRGGAGRAGEVVSPGGNSGIKTILASDKAAQLRHFDDIAAGKAIVVPDE